MSTRKPLRQKKLNVKTALPILREDQIDSSEYESLTTEFQIATGVDHAEENEIHLQAALKGGSASADNGIPVPPPQESAVNYDELYPNPFIEPRNYIKFSDTVEETLGSLYDMSTEDDEYLKTYNAKKAANAQLSENDFERIMEVFEMTASEQTPFAAVDNTIVSYEVMASHMAHSPVSKLHTHTKQVYEYWKSQRQASGNKPLHPSLKFETHQEHDDLDPYVCFRRREVRQTRKRMQRDVMVADKLKKLRRELEDARQFVILSHQRELMKMELLQSEKQLFEHRAKLKQKKVRLGIKENDEDLYNTKPQKRKISEGLPQRAGAPHTSLRLAIVDRRPAEQELVLLSEKQEEKYDELRRDIEAKIQTHKAWNQKHVDLTEKPLSPIREEEEQSFRPAKAQFLPTPPASASDSMDIDDEPTGAVASFKPTPAPYFFRGVSPDPEPVPSYRRRIGRGGRLWIDRRGIGRLASPPSEPEPPITDCQRDQFKYDQDDSDDEQPVYHVDPYETRPMKFRATIPMPMYRYPQRHIPTLADQAGTVNRQAQIVAQAQQQQAAHGQAQSQSETQQGPKPPGQVIP